MTSINSPFPEQDPHPVIPSSVSIRSSVVEREFLTPDRLKTCPSAGIFARNRNVSTSLIFMSLLHFPVLSVDDFTVHHDKIDLFVLSPIAFGVDPHHLWLIAFFGADPKQRQQIGRASCRERVEISV